MFIVPTKNLPGGYIFWYSFLTLLQKVAYLDLSTVYYQSTNSAGFTIGSFISNPLWHPMTNNHVVSKFPLKQSNMYRPRLVSVVYLTYISSVFSNIIVSDYHILLSIIFYLLPSITPTHSSV